MTFQRNLYGCDCLMLELVLECRVMGGEFEEYILSNDIIDLEKW